jgi:hypothetical protein
MISKSKLNSCFDYLYNDDPYITIDKDCHKLITFPNNKTKKKKKIYSHLSFYNKFGKKVKLTSSIIFSNNHLSIPKNLLQQLSRKGSFTLTPIIKNKHMFGLLHDVKNQFWHLFTLPGTSSPPNNKLESLILNLIEHTYKFHIELFYGFIKYLPPKSSPDYDFWPSWIIHLSIKIPGLEREVLVNKALYLILNNNIQYQKFINQFH